MATSVKPLTVKARTALSIAAINFFNMSSAYENCQAIGKAWEPSNVRAFTVLDYMTYVQKLGLLADPWPFQNVLDRLLKTLARVGFLSNSFQGGTPLSASYWSAAAISESQWQGNLWLAPALGADFLFEAFDAPIVHLTGTIPKGDSHAGTGLIVSAHEILTCSHVVREMRLDAIQNVHGGTCRVKEILAHDHVDVAIVRMVEPMRTTPGIAFRDPVPGETVFTLGYPAVPYTREPALIMQRGEVSNARVGLLDGNDAFLFSAIARPGNSGGPIIAETGHVVGIVSDELTMKPTSTGELAAPLPFYAGVPTRALVDALGHLDPAFRLSLETYVY